jgi:hypothetical protein
MKSALPTLILKPKLPMKKFLLCSTIALCLSVSLVAQDSTVLQRPGASNPYSSAPLITIKGEEIRRFPSNNFLDAVNGLFPWVFSLTPNSDDFLFVANGFLLTDVNSISLNDIEEVTFTRNNLHGGLYPFSRAGTFFITLKKATEGKPMFSLNTQYNASFNNSGKTAIVQRPDVIVDESNKIKLGHLFSTHGSVMAAGKKWNLYIAVQLDQSADPGTVNNLYVSYPFISREDSSIFDGSQHQMNIRSFAQFNYRLSSSINVGIYGSYFHGNTKRDTTRLYRSQDNSFNEVAAGTAILPYHNGGAFIDWNILKNFHNRVSFEYLYEKLDDNTNTNGEFSNAQTPLTMYNKKQLGIAHDKRLLLRDELSYAFIHSSKFQAGVSATFSYLNQNSDYKGSYATLSGNGFPSAGSSSMRYDQKLTSLNGKFYFSYKHIINGYAGYARLINKGISRFSSRSKTNPYAGVELNIKNLLNTGNKINRLDLSVNYGDLTRNNSNGYWLPEVPSSVSSMSSTVIGMGSTNFGSNVFSNPSLANFIPKNSLIAVQANIGLLDNKLLAGVEWSRLRLDNLYVITGYNGPDNVLRFIVKGKEVQTGISAYIAAKLVDKPFKKWTIRFNALIPRVQNHIEFYPTIPGTNNQFQAGIQNQFSLHNWFAQLNGLAAFNKTTVNSFMLNYILAGYEFNGSDNSKQKVSVFIQARNFPATGSLKNYYKYYSYLGAGANISF